MFTVVPDTLTLGSTRDQSLVSGCCGSAQYASRILSGKFAFRPFARSNQHHEVGTGADEVATCDGEGERRLGRFRHTSLDGEATQHAFSLPLRDPLSV